MQTLWKGRHAKSATETQGRGVAVPYWFPNEFIQELLHRAHRQSAKQKGYISMNTNIVYFTGISDALLSFQCCCIVNYECQSIRNCQRDVYAQECELQELLGINKLD